MLKADDSLTLNFTTDESLDNTSLLPLLTIGANDRSPEVVLTETGSKDGKSGRPTTRFGVEITVQSTGLSAGMTVPEINW